MSIQSEIERISHNIYAAYNAVQEKGGSVPEQPNSNNLAAAIQGIPAGCGCFCTNPNLLDNWYFVGGGSQQGGGQFPINQRGQTKYSGKTYTVDRWWCSNGRGIVELADDGLKLYTNNTGTSFLRQKLEGIFPVGTILTFSIMIKATASGYMRVHAYDVSYTNETVLDKSEPSTRFADNLDDWTLVSCTVHVTEDNVHPQVIIRNDGTVDGGYILIKAAKLELGTVQTLAHKEGDTWVLNDPPPDYALELAKCQRYFVKYQTLVLTGGFVSGSALKYYMYIYTPVPLRATPSVSMSGWAGRIASGGYSKYTPSTSPVAPTSLSAVYNTQNTLTITDTISKAVDTNNQIMQFNIHDLELDANL